MSDYIALVNLDVAEGPMPAASARPAPAPGWLGRALESVSVWIVLLFAWWVASVHLPLGDNPLLPSPLLTAGALWESLPELWAGTLSSLTILIPGFALATLLGIVAGLAVGTSARLQRIFLPFARVAGPVPPTVYIPYAIAILPTFKLSAIFVVFIGAFWPIFQNAVAGAHALEQRYRDNARILGLSRFEYQRRVVFPAAHAAHFLRHGGRPRLLVHSPHRCRVVRRQRRSRPLCPVLRRLRRLPPDGRRHPLHRPGDLPGNDLARPRPAAVVLLAAIACGVASSNLSSRLYGSWLPTRQRSGTRPEWSAWRMQCCSSALRRRPAARDTRRPARRASNWRSCCPSRIARVAWKWRKPSIATRHTQRADRAPLPNRSSGPLARTDADHRCQGDGPRPPLNLAKTPARRSARHRSSFLPVDGSFLYRYSGTLDQGRFAPILPTTSCSVRYETVPFAARGTLHARQGC
jgi:NitT/TauT family transport system permease protein